MWASNFTFYEHTIDSKIGHAIWFSIFLLLLLQEKCMPHKENPNTFHRSPTASVSLPARPGLFQSFGPVENL